MAKYIEEGTNYSYIVKRMKDVNFRSLRSVSVDFINGLSFSLRSELYENIQHGVCQLQTEAQLNMYIHAFGLMHEAKLQHAFEHLATDFFTHSSIDIIDYGCGQAIGTICYADFLREKGYSQNVRKITLIEPSELALKRAALHVSCFFPNAEIVTILKGFDDLDADDIATEEGYITLHILSNVIDLADDYFDLEDFTILINNNIKVDNYFVCIEPYFNYDEEDDKLQHFVDLLKVEICYRNFFKKGTFVDGKEWTCHVFVCKSKLYDTDLTDNINLSKECPLYFIVKSLIDKGAKYISNCKIEDVIYSINEDRVFVKFILDRSIKGYKLNDDFTCRVTKTNVLYTSLYAIKEILIKNGQFYLGFILYENPNLLNEILKGESVDILQQEVLEYDDYTNPFYTMETKFFVHNVIINHCVNFNLSKRAKELVYEIWNKKLRNFGENNELADDDIILLLNIAEIAKINKDYKEAFKYYKFVADKGDLNAQFNLGMCYEKGQGVGKNNEEAVKWYRKSAEQGHIIAQFNLGFCYANGQGVEKNELEAVKWYRKSAEQGNAVAQFSLALCCENGQGVDKDAKVAVKWYREAAEQGNVSAQINLGVCYKYGKGIVKDEKEAVKWYRKAAEQGDADAQFKLASCYKEGKGVLKNDDEAIKWYIKAAEQGDKVADASLISAMNGEIERIIRLRNLSVYNCDVDKDKFNWCFKAANMGYSNAQNCLGWYYFDVKRDYFEAVRWYTLAANQGNLGGLNNLAFCYLLGRGVEKNISEAIKLYRKSAEGGSVVAQCELARFYKEGKGVPQSDDEAIYWYMKAVEKGYEPAKKSLIECDGNIDWLIKVAEREFVDAQYKLGVLYEKGEIFSLDFERMKMVIERSNVEQSYEKAFSWYLRAVANGSVDALFSLGHLYEQGKGVEQSYEEAVKWYKEAVAKGHNGAKYNLAELYVLGKGVDRNIERALNLLKEYTHRGKGWNFYNFGDLFYFGKGVEQSYEEAVMWWKLSAEENYFHAEYMLGVCYEKGHGVEQSYEEAVKWYLKAVENGDKKAMFNLANCYRYGRGVERSYSNAVKWYKESNMEEAQQALKEISDINNPLVALFKRIKFNLGKLQ